MNLENPKIPFDVGSHEIEVNLPTVLEDFFDLPVFGEFFKMSRFRRAFKTKHFRKDEKKKVINKETNEIETKDIEDESG